MPNERGERWLVTLAVRVTDDSCVRVAECLEQMRVQLQQGNRVSVPTYSLSVRWRHDDAR
jgi:hypothetical protein